MLKLVNISKKYKKNIIALDKINLEFSNSGLVFISGDSGSGKSTLLNILATLEVPTSGSVLYNEKELNKKNSINYLKNDVSIVFQDANLFDNLSVIDNLNIYDDIAEVENLLIRLDIDDLKNKKVKNLSGGEKRRVSIARAILKYPRVLLCDEPEASLDEENRENIFKILKELSKDMLVIVSSHDADIKDYADRIITIQNGHIKEDEIINEISSEEKVGNKEYNVNKKFLKVVSRDILFSKKISFAISVLILSLFSSLLLISGIISKYNYVDILVDTMKHEDNHILLGTGEGGSAYVVGEDVRFIYDHEVSYGNLYLTFNLDIPDGNSVYSVIGDNFYYSPPNFINPIRFNDGFLTGELIGNKPNNQNEVVIYEILAEVLMHYGVKCQDGSILKVNSVDELVGKEVMMYDLPVVISGIVKQDLAPYADFKDATYSDLENFDLLKNIKYETFKGLIDTFRTVALVDDGFFDYISGHYEEEYKFAEIKIGYESDYNKVREYLLKSNDPRKNDINLYTSLMEEGNFGNLDLRGTLYANATNVLFLFYLVGQLVLFLSPILIVIMVYVIMMYFENVYKKNREKFAILSCLGLTNKNMNKVYLNALSIFFGSVLVISILVAVGSIITVNANLSNIVGFYLHPFGMNVTYMMYSMLTLLITFIFSYVFLRLRVKKRNAIMYLKNN